jgi:hypothetical protein
MLRSPRAKKVAGSITTRSLGRLLAGIGIGGELGLAEDRAHAVVADAVARAEVLVGVVVEEAPADGPADLRVAEGGIQHLEVADHVLGLPLLLVRGLGREHVPVELGDEVGDRVPRAPWSPTAGRSAVRGRFDCGFSKSPRMKSFIV